MKTSRLYSTNGSPIAHPTTTFGMLKTGVGLRALCLWRDLGLGSESALAAALLAHSRPLFRNKRRGFAPRLLNQRILEPFIS